MVFGAPGVVESERESQFNAEDIQGMFEADLMIQVFASFDHPRDLVRCESVCKRWRLLISSSNLLWENMLNMRLSDAQYIPVVKKLEEERLL